jgi:hypothetical protein
MQRYVIESMARWPQTIRGTDLFANVQQVADYDTLERGGANMRHYKVFLADVEIYWKELG